MKKLPRNYPQNVNNGRELHFTTSLSRIISLAIASIGGCLIVLGLIIQYIKGTQLVSPASTGNDQASLVMDPKAQKLVKVDASGALERPGVVEIQNDSRILDVLIAAGGVTPNADRNYISKNINLAQRITDGMKIYIPFKGESLEQAQQNVITGRININIASSQQLEELPGIGPVTAKKIIQGSPYAEATDLVRKRIVSQSVYKRIEDLIVAQ